MQTCPEKRRVCITTRASVPVMATHPQPLPFIVDAAGTRLYGRSLEYDSAETDCCKGGGGVTSLLLSHLSASGCSCCFHRVICASSYLQPTRDKHRNRQSKLRDDNHGHRVTPTRPETHNKTGATSQAGSERLNSKGPVIDKY